MMDLHVRVIVCLTCRILHWIICVTCTQCVCVICTQYVTCTQYLICTQYVCAICTPYVICKQYRMCTQYVICTTPWPSTSCIHTRTLYPIIVHTKWVQLGQHFSEFQDSLHDVSHTRTHIDIMHTHPHPIFCYSVHQVGAARRPRLRVSMFSSLYVHTDTHTHIVFMHTHPHPILYHGIVHTKWVQLGAHVVEFQCFLHYMYTPTRTTSILCIHTRTLIII